MTDLRGAAEAVDSLFSGVQRDLVAWRELIAAAHGTDGLVTVAQTFAHAALTSPDTLYVGAGFVAAPGVIGTEVTFAWWLGPHDGGPLFEPTSTPTRLDLSTRGYVDYLRDVRNLEWYAVPAQTRRLHVTGPYIDHLCTCDLILTLTLPVTADGGLLGVVGVDVAAHRLERALGPHLLALAAPALVVSDSGHVVLSTDPALAAGDRLTTTATAVRCAEAPLRIARAA